MFIKLVTNLGKKLEMYSALRKQKILSRLINHWCTEENRRITKGTEHSIQQQEGKIGGEFVKVAKAFFLEERVRVWDELFAKQQERLKSLPREKIVIILRDGKQVEGASFETSP